jgi:hypothetical protein
VVKTEGGIRTVPIYTPPNSDVSGTVEMFDAGTQTDDLETHGLAELREVAELLEDMSTGTPGISLITESRVVLPPADEAGEAETQEELSEEFEVVDDMQVDKMIFVDEQIIDPELEEFINGAIGGGDCVCTFCKGSGIDYFDQECPMCDGLGKCIEFMESVDAVGDKQPDRKTVNEGDWQKIRITLDSGSTVDVMPHDELCQVDAVPCTGTRANRTMFAANGTKIESKGEKKFKAVTDDGFPLDCAFISGAVKKILKSTAITCDEGGEKGQWVIHTKSGGWIVNVETKHKIPFRRVGNTYFMDAWVRVPGKGNGKGKNDMEVDMIKSKKPVFNWQRR